MARPGPSTSNGRPKGVGRRRGHCSSVFAVPRLPMVAPGEPWQSLRSGYRCQPAIGIRVCAKQTLANGFLNKRERFLGFSCFGFSHLGAKLYGRQLILLGFNTRLGLFQCSASATHSPRRYHSDEAERLVMYTNEESPILYSEHLVTDGGETIAAATRRPAQSQTTSGPTR